MKKVLALSGESDFDLDSTGFDSDFNLDLDGLEGFDVTTEAQLGNSNGYKAPASVLKRIAQVTKEEKFDAIIIQNNMGIGLEKAEAVDKSALKKIIVVWNSEPKDYEKAPYQKLGITHFASVFLLRKCLDELIQGGGK